MPASFDGNDGNDGNSANSGGGGNATSVSSGWFFADRVNLPLVTAPDHEAREPATPNVMIGKLPADQDQELSRSELVGRMVCRGAR